MNVFYLALLWSKLSFASSDLDFVSSWMRHVQSQDTSQKTVQRLEDDLFNYIIAQSEQILADNNIPHAQVYLNEDYRNTVRSLATKATRDVIDAPSAKRTLVGMSVLKKYSSDLAIQNMLSIHFGFGKISPVKTLPEHKPLLEEQLKVVRNTTGLKIVVQPESSVSIKGSYANSKYADEIRKKYPVVNNYMSDVGGAGSNNGYADAGEWVSLNVDVKNDSDDWWFSSAITISSDEDCVWIPKATKIELPELGPDADESLSDVFTEKDKKTGKDKKIEVDYERSHWAREIVPLQLYISKECANNEIIDIDVELADTYRTPEGPQKAKLQLKVNKYSPSQLSGLVIDTDRAGHSENDKFSELLPKQHVEIFSEYVTDIDSTSANLSFLVEPQATSLFSSLALQGIESKEETDSNQPKEKTAEVSDAPAEEKGGLRGKAVEKVKEKASELVSTEEQDDYRGGLASSKSYDSYFRQGAYRPTSEEIEAGEWLNINTKMGVIQLLVKPESSTNLAFYEPQDDLDLVSVNEREFTKGVDGLATHWKWNALDQSQIIVAVDAIVKFPSPKKSEPVEVEVKEIIKMSEKTSQKVADVDDVIDLLADYLAISAHHVSTSDDEKRVVETHTINKDEEEIRIKERSLMTMDAVNSNVFQLDFDKEGFEQAYEALITVPGKEAITRTYTKKLPGEKYEIVYNHRYYFAVPVDWNPTENTPGLCSDGLDNDFDGRMDCSDSDCQGFEVCQQFERSREECSDGMDNDNDGKVDCEDSECSSYSYCIERKKYITNDLGYSLAQMTIQNTSENEWVVNEGNLSGFTYVGTIGFEKWRAFVSYGRQMAMVADANIENVDAVMLSVQRSFGLARHFRLDTAFRPYLRLGYGIQNYRVDVTNSINGVVTDSSIEALERKPFVDVGAHILKTKVGPFVQVNYSPSENLLYPDTLTSGFSTNGNLLFTLGVTYEFER